MAISRWERGEQEPTDRAYQELPEDGAFITAQIERNEVVYSVVLTKARNPLSREDVESHFKGELSKK
jgi:hypothetical protein